MNDQLRQRIADTIAKDRVMLFMKGSPQMPQCGFSAAVVGVLKELGAKYGSYNILADNELREGLKEYSSWPTYPQLYVERQAHRRRRHRARPARQGRAREDRRGPVAIRRPASRAPARGACARA
jgi:monothiol glutaredoxin